MKSSRAALYAMAFGNFAVGIGALVIAGVLQPMADSFEVALSQIGLLVTIYALAYAIGSPLLIAFTGTIERRTLLVLGLSLAVLGNVLVAVAPTYAILFIARIITALGAAIFTPIASAVAAQLSEPAERGKAIALVFAGFTAATALGVPFGTYLGLNFGWRLTFGMVAGLAVVGAIFVFLNVPGRIESPPVNLAIFGRVLTNGALVLVLSVTLVQMAAQLSVFTYVAPYVQSQTVLGATGITLLFLANGVSGFFGNLWGGSLTDRIGARPTIFAFLVLLTVAFIAFSAIGTSLVVGVLASILWGVVGLGFNAPQQARLVNLAPQYASAVLGLNASFLYLGISLGSYLGGTVVNQGGLLSLHWLGFGLTILAILIFAISYRTEEKK